MHPALLAQFDPSLIFRCFLGLFGLSFAGGLMLLMQWRHASRWNLLARVYAGDTAWQGERRSFQTALLRTHSLIYSSYKGIVQVEANETGIVLSLIWPFSLFHPKLFLPVEEIQLEPTSWYLNSRSYALTMSEVPEVEMVLDEEIVKWMGAKTGRSWV
ncbi:MAG: hypothetical protein R3B90_22160 [Planctomycetaceae bacterium]